MAVIIALGASHGAVAGPLEKRFADCVGRLSAQQAHQWLMSDPASDRTGQTLATFRSLLDAATSGADQRDALHRSIEAKYRHAAVLQRATFNDDPDDAAWAQRHAALQIAACERLLLRG